MGCGCGKKTTRTVTPRQQRTINTLSGKSKTDQAKVYQSGSTKPTVGTNRTVV